MPEQTSPIDGQTGRSPLHRDEQQWVLDYLIQETGKAYHFQGDGRGELPKSVRSHAMISKHLGQQAGKLERLARVEEEHEHPELALDVYFDASTRYLKAQHPLFELSDQKRFLYDGARRCYDKVRELAPYRIENLDIPFEGSTVSGNLHLDPDVDGPAPLVFYIPGCDSFKESHPHPHFNVAHQRGMHMFSFDGPGHAACNLRGLKLTADNHERAASAALDVLVERDEIDSDQVVLYANSFGAFWGMRFAAHDDRIRAVAATQSSLVEKWIQMDLESPRWKQLMAFLTQAENEEELDAVVADMTMDGYMERIGCPVLLTAGEYDPRAPLHEVYRLFDQLQVPAELWVMVDQHHLLALGEGKGQAWTRAAHGYAVDWLRDRLRGKPIERPGEVRFVRAPDGPYAPSVEFRRSWFEDAN